MWITFIQRKDSKNLKGGTNKMDTVVEIGPAKEKSTDMTIRVVTFVRGIEAAEFYKKFTEWLTSNPEFKRTIIECE